MKKYDLFIFAGEDSGDLHGENLIKQLLKINPQLKILAVAGPKMRKYPITVLMQMEDFHVMGFIDVLLSIFKLIKHFYFLRKALLKINPKKCIFIDYADFNLRLEKSLRKKNYPGKLIHYISPTIWAWRNKRKYLMEKSLDLLLTIFPFEKKYFADTSLKVKYIGHPLAYTLKNTAPNLTDKKYIGIFPGSRQKEIIRNLPIQLKAAKKLLKDDENLIFLISSINDDLIKPIFENHIQNKINFQICPSSENYKIMPKLKAAMATSGTINLELALNQVPTAVNFAIKSLDLFIARNVLKINLPFYSIVNIILNKQIFFEHYGPNLSVDKLYVSLKKLLFDEEINQTSILGCKEVIKNLKSLNANQLAAEEILNI